MISKPPFLEIRDLQVSYGPIRALRGISLDVGLGEVVTLIGANGAGKTTLMRALSRLLPATGAVTLRPENESPIDLLALEPHKVPALGVGHVPEGRGIFLNLSVLENLMMGAYLRSDRDAVRSDLERQLTAFPRLRERLRQQALTLSGGEQQMLAIARALMGRPRLLLLDEPSLGLAPKLVKEVFATIARLNAEGMTILLVEQNAKMALHVSQRGYVLETGQIVLSGPSRELAGHEAVRAAYLGRASAAI
jgi:branched-chain amino acid transport system ATP-binding protein